MAKKAFATGKIETPFGRVWHVPNGTADHFSRDIEKMASTIKGAKKYVIQQFEPDHCDDPEMKKVKPYDDEMIAKMIAAAKKHLTNVKYRGKQDIRT